MENVNLIKILKNAPKGQVRLYSALHGEDLIFVGINVDNIMMLTKDKDTISFHADGSYFKGGECVLFPDKQKRDWEKWHYWLFRYSEGAVIIDQYDFPYLYAGEYYYPTNPRITHDVIRFHKMDFTGSRYATPEETKEYFKELHRYGYTYNTETKKVETFAGTFIPGRYYICQKTIKVLNTINFKKGKVYKAVSTYQLLSNDGNIIDFTTPIFDEYFRKEPWSLEDAKSGDILSNDGSGPFIYKSNTDEGIYAFAGLWKNLEGGPFDVSDDNHYWIDISQEYIDSIHPASDEEVKELFNKMHKAGYNWENLKLNKTKEEKQLKPCNDPFVGMLVKLNPKYYTDPFHMNDKEEALSEIYIITRISKCLDMEVTMAPIDTRSVVTLDFADVEDACPINIEKYMLAREYYVADENVTYDVKFLETWDKVLVKNLNSEEWEIARFSHLRTENGQYKFICDKGKYNICIPWNEATAHLVGTTDTPIPIYDMKID